MKTIALFNHRAGVGKTTLAFHLAWMMHRLGERVLAVDLDPQANLTEAFLDDRTFDELLAQTPPATTYGAIASTIEHGEALGDPPVHEITDGLALIAGDLSLTRLEKQLAESWLCCLDDDETVGVRALRTTASVHQLIVRAAAAQASTIAIIDIGPSLSALNRAALIATDFVVIPSGSDPRSLHGLATLGSTLDDWRSGWATRRARTGAASGLDLPSGAMQPLGYIVMRSPRMNELLNVLTRGSDKLSEAFHTIFLHEPPPAGEDPSRLALIRPFRSLLPMAQEARKPVFDLTAADGAIGSHAAMVRDVYDAFATLAKTIGTSARLGQWTTEDKSEGSSP